MGKHRGGGGFWGDGNVFFLDVSRGFFPFSFEYFPMGHISKNGGGRLFNFFKLAKLSIYGCKALSVKQKEREEIIMKVKIVVTFEREEEYCD